MSLHGTIEVNGQAVGWWTARRTEPLEPHRQRYDYECCVDWTAVNLTRQRDTFVVQHDYTHGAVALAARVLGEAAHKPGGVTLWTAT